MFSLFQGFYEELSYVPERKIALLGVESCGKSSILEWLKAYMTKSDSPTSIARPPALQKMTPTVGLNVAKLRHSGDKLLVWDLGGTKSLRSIWDRYVEEAQALIWVVDSVDEAMLHESCEALKKLVALPHLARTPLLVFANKQDLNSAIDPVRISLELDLLSDAEKRSQCVQPCSAETGEGIREGIDWLVKSLQGNAKLEMRIP